MDDQDREALECILDRNGRRGIELMLATIACQRRDEIEAEEEGISVAELHARRNPSQRYIVTMPTENEFVWRGEVYSDSEEQAKVEFIKAFPELLVRWDRKPSELTVEVWS